MTADPRDKRDIHVVARTIAAERVRHGMTQEQLAATSGVSLATVQRMEDGSTDSSLSRYIRVARAIGIAPTVLLERLDP